MISSGRFRWAGTAFLFSLLLAFVLLYARARFLTPVTYDEELFIWQGWLLTKGSVPYRDFFENKPLVIYFANALSILAFGLKSYLFRILPTAIALLSLLVFCRALLKRRIPSWLTILLTAQVALWLLGNEFHEGSLNDTETYGFALTLIGFSLGSLSCSTGIRSATILLPLLSGICFGLAICSKELFALSVVPAWLLGARALDTGEWRWRQLWLSAVGVIAVAVVALVYLVTQSAMGPYLDTIRFSRTFADNYGVDIGRFPRVSGFAVILWCGRILHDRLYNFAHLAFALPLWAAALLSCRRKESHGVRPINLAIAAAAVLLGMLAISVGYCFWRHYFLMGTTGLMLLTLVGAEGISRFLSEKRPIFSVIAFGLLTCLFVFVAWNPTRGAIADARRAHGEVPWWFDSVVIETIEGHSKPGDYVLATESPLILAVMDRKNPLPFGSVTDEILPYMGEDNPALRIEVMRDNLEKYRPKVCYFGSWLRYRQVKWHALVFDPFLAKHNYVQVSDRVWYLPEAK